MIENKIDIHVHIPEKMSFFLSIAVLLMSKEKFLRVFKEIIKEALDLASKENQMQIREHTDQRLQ